MDENYKSFGKLVKKSFSLIFTNPEEIDFSNTMEIYYKIYFFANQQTKKIKPPGSRLYEIIEHEIENTVKSIELFSDFKANTLTFKKLEKFYDYLEKVFSYLDSYYVRYSSDKSRKKLCHLFSVMFFDIYRRKLTDIISSFYKELLKVKTELFYQKSGDLKPFKDFVHIYRKLIGAIGIDQMLERVEYDYVKNSRRSIGLLMDDKTKQLPRLLKKTYFEMYVASYVFGNHVPKQIATVISPNIADVLAYIKTLIFHFKKFVKSFKIIMIVNNALVEDIKKIFSEHIMFQINSNKNIKAAELLTLIEKLYRQLDLEHIQFFEKCIKKNSDIEKIAEDPEIRNNINRLIIDKLDALSLDDCIKINYIVDSFANRSVIHIINEGLSLFVLILYEIFYSDKLASLFRLYSQKYLLRNRNKEKIISLERYFSSKLNMDSILKTSILCFDNSFVYGKFSVTLLIKPNWEFLCNDGLINNPLVYTHLASHFMIPSKISSKIDELMSTFSNVIIQSNMSMVRIRLLNTDIACDQIVLLILTMIRNKTFDYSGFINTFSIVSEAVDKYLNALIMKNVVLKSNSDEMYRFDAKNLKKTKSIELFFINTLPGSKKLSLKENLDTTIASDNKHVLQAKIMKIIKSKKHVDLEYLFKVFHKYDDLQKIIDELIEREYISQSEDKKILYYS